MQKHAGFSLLELMMALALAAIAGTLAIPNLTRVIEQNRVVAYSNGVLGAVNLARSTAVTRGVPVSVCARRAVGASQCNTAATADWAKGWLVFVDSAGALGQIDADDEVLKVYPAIEDRTGLSLTGTRRFLSYESSGMLTSDAMTLQLRQVHCRTNVDRDIHVTLGGSSYVQQKSC